jgi:hypothetical protein
VRAPGPVSRGFGFGVGGGLTVWVLRFRVGAYSTGHLEIDLQSDQEDEPAWNP